MNTLRLEREKTAPLNTLEAYARAVGVTFDQVYAASSEVRGLTTEAQNQ